MSARAGLAGMQDALQHPRALRGFVPSGVRSMRLCSGLVLFTYIFLHFVNHALGNISLAWMERGLLVQKFVWQGVIGTAALYSALAVHFVLGLWALYERRRLHWTASELAQLLLGLAVPPLLANHLAGTRIAFTAFGLNKGYAQELYSFWVASPFLGWTQFALLVVAWTHGCLGLHFWLRLRPWYDRARSWLLAAAVLLPVLALLGYFQAGRTVTVLAQDPIWRAGVTPATIVGTDEQATWLANLRNGFLLFDGTALVAILLARLARAIRDRHVGRFRVSYPDGQAAVDPARVQRVRGQPDVGNPARERVWRPWPLLAVSRPGARQTGTAAAGRAGAADPPTARGRSRPGAPGLPAPPARRPRGDPAGAAGGTVRIPPSPAGTRAAARTVPGPHVHRHARLGRLRRDPSAA